jgi:DNA replication protein DnaC
MVFGNYNPTCQRAAKVKADCQEYVSGFKANAGNSLMMVGSPGTGKNMLAAIICQDVVKKGFTALHTTAIKLVRRVKDSWRNKEESEQAVIDYFVTPDLLVIDEIGVQFGSQTEQLYLTEVINDRYERRRPTILISNLKLSQLSDVLGERVVDRFYDDGSKMMVFDWESYRRRAKGI